MNNLNSNQIEIEINVLNDDMIKTAKFAESNFEGTSNFTKTTNLNQTSNFINNKDIINDNNVYNISFNKDYLQPNNLNPEDDNINLNPVESNINPSNTAIYNDEINNDSRSFNQT